MGFFLIVKRRVLTRLFPFPPIKTIMLQKKKTTAAEIVYIVNS